MKTPKFTREQALRLLDKGAPTASTKQRQLLREQAEVWTALSLMQAEIHTLRADVQALLKKVLDTDELSSYHRSDAASPGESK